MSNYPLDVSTPVLILGGQQNALSIVRSLGRAGVRVLVASDNNCAANYSRYCAGCFSYPKHTQPGEFWRKLLLSNRPTLAGSMLLACNDDAIEFVAENKQILQEHYVVDENIAELQMHMLDKQKTLELAQAANCFIPQYWKINSIKDVENISSISFPAMVKPLHSHKFRLFYRGQKYLMANDMPELIRTVAGVIDKKLDVMVCEMIPGPDNQFSSYYTYIDDQNNALFRFTKRVIRRWPVNEGGGTYHISKWDEETAEIGERFFRGINFRGLGSIEFKRDLRDGKLKVMECNARFTAAQELLVQSGMDISILVYRRLSGQTVPEFGPYRDNVRLLEPVFDYRSYKQLKARGEITFRSWVSSLLHKQHFAYFRIDDPLPSIAILYRAILRRILKLRNIASNKARARTFK